MALCWTTGRNLRQKVSDTSPALRSVRHFPRFVKCLTLFARKGQAMVEYLVIATVVIAALLAVRPALQAAIQALFDNAATKANEAATNLGNLNVP